MSFKGSRPDIFPGAGPENETLPLWGVAQIAGYQIEGEVGRGGMATVYRAVQQSLGRQVALKILVHRPEEDVEFAQRFKKEGRILARLLHPHIITIHDVGISKDQHLFLAVEYLPGGTLNDRIKQGLSFESAIQIIKAIARALEYAHERGVVHRDVKPSNILFRQDGTPVLTDFGVARTAEPQTAHTVSGLTVGSPGYMSPEQAMGEIATIQSDLYSLGVVFYEMLAGRRLYEAGNAIAVTLKHLYEPIPELPTQYAYLQPVLNRMLAKKSSNRYKNMGEFLEALDSITPEYNNPPPQNPSDLMQISLIEFTTGKIRRLLKKRGQKTVFISIASLVTLIAIATIFYLFFTPKSPLGSLETSESSSRQEQTITALLKLAEMQLKMGLFAEETGEDNAKATYQRILMLDPENSQAKTGLESIAREYEKKARQKLEAGALQDSLQQIQLGLSITPEHSELLHLRQEVEHRTAEINAKKAREEERQQYQLQAEQFLSQAQTSLQEGLLEISLAHIQQGLMAAPDHSGLLALRKQVQARIAEHQRQAEESLRQTEIAKRQKAEQARQREEEAQRQAEIAEQQKAEQARQQKEMVRRQAAANQYLTQALDYRRKGNYAASLQKINQGLALIPNHNDLLRLREQVRADQSAAQQQREARRQAAKAAKRQNRSVAQPVARSPQKESNATLKKLEEIREAVDALDRSLDR